MVVRCRHGLMLFYNFAEDGGATSLRDFPQFSAEAVQPEGVDFAAGPR